MTSYRQRGSLDIAETVGSEVSGSRLEDLRLFF